MLFDVFTNVAFAGNQLAVFPQALDDAGAMQKLARELNLAESVFLTRGSGDVAAALRIFTPLQEIPFAGHPTIGASIAIAERLAWIDANATAFSLRLKVGDVPITLDRTQPLVAWLQTPRVTFGKSVARDAAAAICGVAADDVRDDVACSVAGAGSPFLYVPLTSREAVDRAELDAAAVRRFAGWDEVVGVYLFAQTDDGAYARMFAPMSGIAEDPATGSATGPLYALLAKHGAIAPPRERFVNEQGVAMGRRSVLFVRLRWNGDALDRIDVGGHAVYVGEGALRVPGN